MSGPAPSGLRASQKSWCPLEGYTGTVKDEMAIVEFKRSRCGLIMDPFSHGIPTVKIPMFLGYSLP